MFVIEEKHTTRAWLIVLLLAAIALALVIGWVRHNEQAAPTPPVNLSIPAKPAPEVKSVPKAEVSIKAPVKVYKGGKGVKNNLKLPAVVADDPAQEVLASSQVKPDDHPQTITTVINTDTGESQTFVKRDPLPWLAWDTHGEAGIYAGIRNGQPTARLEAKQGVFRVKALHFGVTASVDQPIGGTPRGADTFVGAGVWAEW